MSELYNKSELHLFLIWNKAYYKLDDIVNDIARNFNIIKKIEIRWSLNLFSQNLTQFYGAKLPQNSFKEKHCGTGPFTVIIVNEISSKYEKRKTSKGIYKVNVRMFDAKTKFRLWTGGGHKIHATNSVLETEHDLMLLLGKTKTDIELKVQGELDDLIVLNRDIEGAKGWENLTHLFKILNYFFFKKSNIYINEI